MSFKQIGVRVSIGLVALAVVIMTVWTIVLGPQVGSVFSAVTKGLGGGSVSSTTSNPATTAAVAQSTNAQTLNSQGQPLPDDRLIIRNATLSLTSPDVEKTLGEIRVLAIGQNGLVFQSNTSIRDDKAYGTITIQVPSAAFDSAMNQLRRLSDVKVESENTTSQDVTEEYVDLKAQVSNLKASETELVRLMTKTTNVGEILNVQKELTGVRGEIERRLGRLNYLEKKSAMSNLVISIAPAALPARKDEPTKGWDALKALETAWAGSVRGLQILFVLGATVGAWMIWLGPLLGLIWLGYRWFARKRAKTFSDLTP